MILYEYEGKKLLSEHGLATPRSQLITSADQEIILKPSLVLKAQVLSGNRAREGGIMMIDQISNLQFSISNLFKKIINGEVVEKVLVEEKIDFDKEYYLSISYDTDTRGPILTFSQRGGTGVEQREAKTFKIDPLTKKVDSLIFVSDIDKELIKKLINLFFDQDLTLLEINPLVRDKNGQWIALDVKIKLDDEAKFRHPEWNYGARSVPGHTPTQREIEAKKIDQGDYRGTAGSAYFDLDGDIAVLSSGGGVSLTALDALISLGGKPANFTEYSGNPPKEKVVKLTKIVLSKPNIHGLWVIGTVAANFTDIYETLSGLIEGLRQAEKELGTKFDFPIVIRRGGPREKEAFKMLREVKDFNLILQGEETSIFESAKVMVEKALTSTQGKVKYVTTK